jgi:hypothetical protein
MLELSPSGSLRVSKLEGAADVGRSWGAIAIGARMQETNPLDLLDPQNTTRIEYDVGARGPSTIRKQMPKADLHTAGACGRSGWEGEKR